ncbi:MAG TPA: hypothetical protein VFK34_08065 [Marmoricola sp.]|jgi:hypothetical protein|nr:hypothetical protein [Marmoricola sp.]
MTEQRPERVRVTGPRAGRPRQTTVAAEIDRQSEIGELYMHSLMRSQFRLALLVVSLLAVTVGALPLLFRKWPALRHVDLFGVPLPWLVLGFLVYPLLVALAWFYVRRAERNERDFNDLVGPR